MPHLHLESLTPKGKELFPKLASLGKEFYLAGGTALALQLGHRQSVDFDFFTDTPIASGAIKAIEKIFVGSAITPIIATADELTVSIDDVKLSLVHYPFPVLLPFVATSGINLLSAREIAVTKSYTIGRRGALKDYIDLYFCLHEKVTTLAEIIAAAQKKYTHAFVDRLFLEQIVYMGDIAEDPIIFLRTPVARAEMIAYFSAAIAEMKIIQ